MSWSLNKSEWPNIPTGSIGLLAPLIYGKHNSSGLSGTGMLTAIPVDYTAATIGWYIVCAGGAKLIREVYVNGVLQTGGGTDYTRDYATTKAGKVYTIVKFTDIPAADAVVTIDADGYETTGNTAVTSTAPTGSVIVNPVEQIRHLLINFAEKGWQSGAWYSDASSAVIDSSSWAECVQWAERHQLEGAGYLGGTTTSLQTWDVFNAWLDTWSVFRAYWTASGRIGLRVIDIEFPGYRQTTDHPLLRPEHEMGEGGSGEYDQDTSNLSDTFISEYLYDEVQGQYLATLTATDPDAGSGITTSAQMLWSVRRAV